MSQPKLTPEALDALQRETFDYFIHEANPANGLIADKTQAGAPASIAAVGLALAAYPVGVERGFISRTEAIERTLATLRFFRRSVQGTDAQATGYKGFYYHFLDMKSGKRVWNCELSTIDSTFLLAGMLAAAAYFQDDARADHEIRTVADELYRRADWPWAQNEGATVTHGWRPETGFLPYRWQGYDEALLVYLLGLGSPTHPLSEESYTAWASTYQWRKIYDRELLYAGPLFTHQLSHLWVDFRGIQDEYMRGHCIDYFENSRRATYVQQRYAVHNPRQFEGYGENCWGITASDGPGWVTRRIKGKLRRFFGYAARGVPDGPDDGTLAPWAVVAALPFAPEIVLPALRHFDELKLRVTNPYGYKGTFNLTYREESDHPCCWVTPWHYGLNQGPIVLMIENFRAGTVWRLMRQCPYLVRGLRRAGFAGGWLGTHHSGRLLPVRAGRKQSADKPRGAAGIANRGKHRSSGRTPTAP
ncbi:MAG TPA: glucoamylase family protein [Gemmataceae bacterium]|nr:glucoamylase family protein [Gemmataceae bacterium]